MCQFFLFCETSINIIKNMEIFLSSETTEKTNWFSDITMLMTHMLLINVILITGKSGTNWQRTLKEALLQNFLWPPFSCHCMFVLTLPGWLLSAKAARCCSALDATGRCCVRSCTLLTHPHWMGCLTLVILKNSSDCGRGIHSWFPECSRSAVSFSPELRSRHSAKGHYDLACFA